MDTQLFEHKQRTKLFNIKPKSNMFGPAFTRRWRSLPDELKVKVLSYNLIFKGLVFLTNHAGKPTVKVARDGCGSRRLRTLGVTGLLQGSSEVSSLATEIFYSKNTFELLPGSGHGCTSSSGSTAAIWYPKRSVNHYIRHVKISISICDNHWRFLARLADGELGFDNLQSIELIVWGPHGFRFQQEKFTPLLTIRRARPVVFKVKKLDVYYGDNRSLNLSYPQFMVERMDELRDAVFTNLTTRLDTETKEPKEVWLGSLWNSRQRILYY